MHHNALSKQQRHHISEANEMKKATTIFELACEKPSPVKQMRHTLQITDAYHIEVPEQ